ncbi:MAG: alpha/beta hydrolase [Promethearchaeota archaeon]
MNFSLEDYLCSSFVSERLFHPRQMAEPSPEEFNAEILNFVINSGISIGGLFFGNESENPTMLIFHGNGEIACDYSMGIEEYLSCGVNVGVIDFRGYGWSTGTLNYLNLITDAVQIFNKFTVFLEEKNFSTKIFVLGRSLGSICAAEIGAHRFDNILGIIFDSGFADSYTLFQTIFGINLSGISHEDLLPYTAKPRLAKIEKPTLILHGTADRIIPFNQAQEIYKTLPNNIFKRLVPIKGAHHNTIHTFTEEYFDELNVFCRRVFFPSS